MMKYYFDLVAADQLIIDDDGTDLPDRGAAMQHARAVARETMKGAEISRRHWRLRLRDGEGTSAGSLLFASVDRTLDHLAPRLRQAVEDVCRRYAELSETAAELRMIMLETRGFLASYRRQPFLVAVGGRRIAAMPHATGPRSGSHPRA